MTSRVEGDDDDVRHLSSPLKQHRRAPQLIRREQAPDDPNCHLKQVHFTLEQHNMWDGHK